MTKKVSLFAASVHLLFLKYNLHISFKFSLHNKGLSLNNKQILAYTVNIHTDNAIIDRVDTLINI